MDYTVYRLTLRDAAQYGTVGGIAALFIAWTFYRSIAAGVLFFPIGCICYPLYKRRALQEARAYALSVEFKEAVGILSSFLSAGYSVENAFSAAHKEAEGLLGERAMMTRELSVIVQGMRLNKPVELLLMDFACRSASQDVRNFAEVVAIAKRNGGDLRAIADRTAEVIREKAAVNEEIKNLTAARRYEQRIMSLLPAGMILYINLTSGAFLAVMYETMAGRLIMTFCLLLFFASALLSKRLLQIVI